MVLACVIYVHINMITEVKILLKEIRIEVETNF